MKRFKNILAVYRDAVGDNDVLIQASSLARANQARLTIIEVVNGATTSEAQLDERKKHLSLLADSFAHLGIEIETTVQTGRSFLQIIQQVLRADHDLVIMAADSVSGFKKLFFGSTSMHLMRKCPCPVWIIKPGSGTGFTRIAAAVDTSPDEPDVSELNVKIMDMATSLARENASGLCVFHAWELVGSDLDTMRSETTDEIRQELLQRNEGTHRQALDHLLERYSLDDIPLEICLQRGAPTSQLPKLVSEKCIDLLVMGTVSRGGIAGLLMGNSAEIILRQVECSVSDALTPPSV